MSGKEISGSFRFNGFNNLHNAFGKVDILSAKLKGKDIDVILLDTYDFNPNEKNWKVQMGYSVQKANFFPAYLAAPTNRFLSVSRQPYKHLI